MSSSSKITDFLIEGLGGNDVETISTKISVSFRLDPEDLPNLTFLEDNLDKTRSEILRVAVSAGLSQMSDELNAALNGKRKKITKEG